MGSVYLHYGTKCWVLNNGFSEIWRAQVSNSMKCCWPVEDREFTEEPFETDGTGSFFSPRWSYYLSGGSNTNHRGYETLTSCPKLRSSVTKGRSSYNFCKLIWNLVFCVHRAMPSRSGSNAATSLIQALRWDVAYVCEYPAFSYESRITLTKRQ